MSKKHNFGLIYLSLISSVIFILLTACTNAATTTNAVDNQRAVSPVSADDLNIVTGQTLYVPAYSEIFIDDQTTTIDLAIMLSIRNTDVDQPIVIKSIAYYDTNGDLVKEYMQTPLELSSMATTEVVIERQDKRGGTGANFVVQWGAEQPVHEPVVEALMTSTVSQQGISFISQARVIEESPAR